MKYKLTKKARNKLSELREKRWNIDTALTLVGKIAEDGMISERELINKAGLSIEQAKTCIRLLESMDYIEQSRGEE